MGAITITSEYGYVIAAGIASGLFTTFLGMKVYIKRINLVLFNIS
jgi:hypothetical protein